MNRLGILLCFGVLVALQSSMSQRARAQLAEQETVRTSGELFDLFGMDEAFFRRFASDTAWSEGEQAPLLAVLMRLREITLLNLHRWTTREFAWKEVAGNPATYQRQFLRLDGRVRRVVRTTPAAEQRERFGITHFYRCEFATADGGPTVIVFAADVPRKWPLDQPIDENASANAIFLSQKARSDADASDLYFAAHRVAWHPDTELGKARMDYGLFDTVEQNKPITKQDRECFYQMLAAAGRAARASETREVADPVPQLGGLTKSPSEHVGEAYTFRGVARRAVRIQINDRDVIERLGFDHYFDVVVFVELNGVLDIAGEKVRSFPVVFCLRELPAGMPTGENIAEIVRAQGFMFKKWKYNTQLAEEKKPGLRIKSPLLIGKSAVWEQREEARRLIDPVVGGSIAAAAALVGLVAWWFNRRDRKIHSAVVAKSHSLGPGQSLDNLDLNALDAADETDRD